MKHFEGNSFESEGRGDDGPQYPLHERDYDYYEDELRERTGRANGPRLSDPVYEKEHSLHPGSLVDEESLPDWLRSQD